MSQPKARSNTSKPESQPAPAPQKRGFFAAAGQRLKRAISGTATAEPRSPAAPELEAAAEDDGTQVDPQSSIHDKARELLLQDRAQGAGRRATHTPAADEAPAPQSGSKATPPPLPSQRAAQDSAEPTTGVLARAEPTAVSLPAPPEPRKRPQRGSKSAELRARLGVAKALLAQTQAHRSVTEHPPAESAEQTAPALDPLVAAAASETTETCAELADASSASSDAPAGEPAATGADDAASDATEHAPSDAAGHFPVAAAPPDLSAATEEPEQAGIDARAEASADEAAALSGMLDGLREPLGGAAPATQPGDSEPIRTLTIARLLAGQGYFERSLSIYEELLALDSSDAALRAEAEQVQARQSANERQRDK